MHISSWHTSISEARKYQLTENDSLLNADDDEQEYWNSYQIHGENMHVGNGSSNFDSRVEIDCEDKYWEQYNDF